MTIDRAPTRSPYSEKDFENELETKKVIEQAHCCGVFVDTVTEALIGDVDEGHVLLGAQNLQYLLPVFGQQIDAGGVVAARMQHHDRARRKVLQVFKHAGAVNAMGGCVVIGVVLHRKAGGFEQSAVVFPARVADGDHGIGQDPLEEVGADLQCASTAQGLAGDHTALGYQG